MRKLAAIFFLLILLFNTAGYRWYFAYLEKRATAELETRIDAGMYEEEQLVEIRIPLNMPYYSDREYEAVYGETEWEGQHYRYVKRKVTNNILYLLCLPHNDKDKLVNAGHDYAKQVNDLPSKHADAPAIKLLFSEYICQARNSIDLHALNNTLNFYQFNTRLKFQHHPDAPYQPPRAARFA